MVKGLKNINIFEDKVFAIVGIVFGDTLKYHIFIVDKRKEQLSISKSICTTDFEDVKKSVNKNIPLLINFSGKGIISKKVAPSGNYLNEILFNGSSDQFYTYTFFEKENNFVSIGRREMLDEQFALFEKNLLKPIDYSIGPFVSSLAKEFFDNKTLVLEAHELKFDNGSLIDFTNTGNSEKECKFGDELLKSHEVTLVGTLLNFLYPSKKIEYETDFLNGNHEEQKFKKIFDSAAVASLVIFLIALFGSYLLLHYFNGEYVKHEEQLYLFNDNYTQIKKMEGDLQRKQYVVSQSGLLKNNFLTYYVNEIGKTVPDQIILNNVQVNPITKKIKSNEKVVVESRVILIDGKTEGSIYVSNWIKELKESKWIDKIEILNISSNKNGEDSFSLKIYLI